MLGKFDRESLIRTLMQAGDVSLDDPPCLQFKTLEFVQGLRVKEALQ